MTPEQVQQAVALYLSSGRGTEWVSRQIGVSSYLVYRAVKDSGHMRPSKAALKGRSSWELLCPEPIPCGADWIEE